MEIIEGYDCLDEVMALFKEYQQCLGIDLEFQEFDKELLKLPGVYAKPKGRLYLMKEEQTCFGCIALKPLDDKTAEIKRLYVNPKYRKSGAGRLLLQRIITDATDIGYQRVVLDTLESLSAAVRLYRSFGFHEIEAYYENPLEDVLYFEKIL